MQRGVKFKRPKIERITEWWTKVGQLDYCKILGVNLLLLTMKDCAIINNCSLMSWLKLI